MIITKIIDSWMRMTVLGKCISITIIIIVAIILLKIIIEYKRQRMMFNDGICRKCGNQLVYLNNFKGRVYTCGQHYMTYVTFRFIDRKYRKKPISK